LKRKANMAHAHRAGITALTLLLVMGQTALSGLVSASGDLSRQKPVEVRLQVEANYFRPAHLEMETGLLYKLVIENKTSETHRIVAPELTDRVFTRKIEVRDSQGRMMVLLEGQFRGLEQAPGARVEWWFVPVATGDGIAIFCDKPGHAEAGKKTLITIK